MTIPAKVIATPGKGPAKSGRKGRAKATASKNTASAAIRQASTGKLIRQVTGVPNGNRSAVISSIAQGLSFKAVELIEDAMGLSRKDMPALLAISTSTLTRRQRAGRLRPDESDRLARYAQLNDAAVVMMNGDDEAAATWLRTPSEILGGETPIQHARTEMGAREVEDLIGRIRHGVFS